MEFRESEFVGPRTKVHLLDEGYAWVSEIRDFAEDSSEESRKSNFSGLGGVLETFFNSSVFQEVEILPTLVYFPL